jgi:hypothetical protein
MPIDGSKHLIARKGNAFGCRSAFFVDSQREELILLLPLPFVHHCQGPEEARTVYPPAEYCLALHAVPNYFPVKNSIP